MKKVVKIIIILIIITVILIGGLLIWKNSKNENVKQDNREILQTEKDTEGHVQILEDGSKLNVSEEFLKPKTIDGIEINNIQLKEKDGITTLLADVENKTEKATPDKIIKIEILDNEGKVIIDLMGVIKQMEVGGKVQLNIAVTADIANAYNFRIINQ